MKIILKYTRSFSVNNGFSKIITATSGHVCQTTYIILIWHVPTELNRWVIRISRKFGSNTRIYFGRKRARNRTVTKVASVPRIRFYLLHTKKKGITNRITVRDLANLSDFSSETCTPDGYVNYMFQTTKIYWCVRQRISKKTLSCLWTNSKIIKR